MELKFLQVSILTPTATETSASTETRRVPRNKQTHKHTTYQPTHETTAPRRGAEARRKTAQELNVDSDAPVATITITRLDDMATWFHMAPAGPPEPRPATTVGVNLWKGGVVVVRWATIRGALGGLTCSGCRMFLMSVRPEIRAARRRASLVRAAAPRRI